LLAGYLLWRVRSIPVSESQLATGVLLSMRLFAIVGRVPALAGQKTVPVSKIKLQLGLIFGIRIRIEFYLLRTGPRTRFLDSFLLCNRNWNQNQNTCLWEKNLTRKEVNHQLSTGFWSELVRTRPKLGLISKTKTRISLLKKNWSQNQM